MPAYVRQNSRISLFACTRPSQDDVFTVGPHIFGRLIFFSLLNNVEEISRLQVLFLAGSLSTHVHRFS